MSELQDILNEISKISQSFKPQPDLKLAIEQLATEYKTNILLLEEKQKKLSILKQEKKRELHILAHLKEVATQ